MNWPVQDELVIRVYDGLWKRLLRLTDEVIQPTRETRVRHIDLRFSPDPSEDRWNFTEEMVNLLAACK